MMDLVLRLREARRLRGLSQKDVARLSGVGEKTISSFETGDRIDSIKVEQLRKVLSVYGMAESEFLGDEFEARVMTEVIGRDDLGIDRLVRELGGVEDEERRRKLVRSFLGMVDLTKQSERRGTRLG